MRVGATPPLIILLAVMTLARCGKAGENGHTSDLTYSLARTATNTTSNSLHLSLSKPKGFTFQIDGEGFDADVSLGEPLDIQDVVQLAFSAEGRYAMRFKVFYEDGSVMLEDELVWEYSTKIPDDPIISFSEVATNDRKITMLAPYNLDPDTNELWVEGDIPESEKGWHLIQNLSVNLLTTKDDGMKTFKVKHRNIFGSESSWETVKILKKSVGPTNCEITSNTTVTGSGQVILHLSAINDGKLYYLLSGDLAGATGRWVSFEDEIAVAVKIIDNNSVNKIKVQLRDIADNFCPSKTFNITYDEDHKPFLITVEDGLLTTESEFITVLPQLDYNPADEVLMYIHGNIEDTADTFEWIPYASSVDVELTPVDGNRHVRVKYKVNGEESAVYSVPIYLKPFIRWSGSSAPYNVSLSEIVDLTSLTVTGCVEVYNNISPTTSVSCTPNDVTLSVIYLLSDGTTVSKSIAAP